MPFKDNAGNFGASGSFDGRRAAKLGASLLDAIEYVAAQLRGVDEPSFGLADDAYIAPTEDVAEVTKYLSANQERLAPGTAKFGGHTT